MNQETDPANGRMILPLCKCGHTAFFHAGNGAHYCQDKGPGGAGWCSCEAFAAVPPLPPTTDYLAVANSPNFPAQPTVWPDAAERRRYALLQAAAVLLSADHWQGVAQAAHEAEALLVEIERREAERVKEGL